MPPQVSILRPPAVRGALVALLLFAEATLFTGRVDVGALRPVDALWAELLLASRVLLPASIAVAAGLLVFGRASLVEAIREEGGSGGAPRRFLPLHFTGLGAFWLLTLGLFTTPPSDPLVGAAGLVAWLGAGATTLAAALCLVLSPATWRLLLRRGAGAFALGTTVGIAAFAAGHEVEALLWDPLSGPTLWSVEALLSSVLPGETLPPVGTILGTGRFSVDVGVGCSGYEGIGLVAVFLSAYLFASRARLRFPRAFALLPLGFLCVWSANVLRLVTLILIGHAGAPELAIGGFHTRAGWVLFCAVALGLVALAERTPWLLASGGDRAVERTDPTRRVAQAAQAAHAPALPPLGSGDGNGDSRPWPYVAPLLCLLGVQLVGGAVTERVDLVHALAVGAALTALFLLRGAFTRLRILWSPTALLAGLGVCGVWILTAPRGAALQDGSAPEAAALVASPGIPLFLRVFSTVLLVPIAEELAFRGFLLRRLIRARFETVSPRTWTPFALVASSLLFGLAHERWAAGTFAGLVYAAVVLRSGRLADAIVAHAVTNALLIAWALR